VPDGGVDVDQDVEKVAFPRGRLSVTCMARLFLDSLRKHHDAEVIAIRE
jgi:hypothetical protein